MLGLSMKKKDIYRKKKKKKRGEKGRVKMGDGSWQNEMGKEKLKSIKSCIPWFTSSSGSEKFAQKWNQKWNLVKRRINSH